jgi:hypothetical protein
MPTDWSRDGRFILFTQKAARGNWQSWALPLFGDRKPVPLLQTEFNEADCVFSPDNRWIAYDSDESGRGEVYVRAFAEGGAGVKVFKRQVSTAGGSWARWRRDGKELFFRALDGKLMAVPVKAGSTFEPGIPVALFNAREYDGTVMGFDASPDGQRFLVSPVIEGNSTRPVNICLNWLAGVKK